MTGRTTRIAALGAGALLSLGIIGAAAPAGASDGVQTDATVSAGTADAVSQTLGLVNQACVDAANVTATGSSALASDHGIAVASDQAGTGLKLAVSLPALTDSLPVLGSLPVVGSAGQLQAKPLDISCATSADGTGLGVSAAGVDALVHAIAPGIDISGLDLSGIVPTAGLDASTAASASAPRASGTAAASPAGATVSSRATGQSPAVRASASAAPRTATASLSAQPASSSGGIVGQTLGSPGALARTGAGVGILGLLGTALVGSGRLLTFGRKLLRIG
ncbi:MAG: hypothetical protein QOI86_634 [Actinomycetota bacterium]|jgi:hypothetical protein|nr:hypothetical protein [Actinomycetota bacterium]